MHCKKCSEFVDTDNDTDCWIETKYEDLCYCEPCRDEYYEEIEALENAAEKQMQRMEIL